jgi:transposase-like protein
MDSGWLARQLGEGRSIESIAREVGLHSSTVSYWVEKHGLRSRHAEKHASRGPINREELADLIEEHLSVRGIAERLGVSSTTVRYWLERYDLRTIRAQRRDLSKLGRSQDLQAVPGVCPKHGDVWLVRRDYGYRCQRCRSEAVTARRQRNSSTRRAGNASHVATRARRPRFTSTTSTPRRNASPFPTEA